MYLVLSQASTDYAAAISEALYSLSRPEHVRLPSDTTRYFCSWVSHPGGTAVALNLPGESLPVHAEADPAVLSDLIATVIGAEQAGELHASIDAARGGRAIWIEFLPAALLPALRTRSQLQVAGWFAE